MAIGYQPSAKSSCGKLLFGFYDNKLNYFSILLNKKIAKGKLESELFSFQSIKNRGYKPLLQASIELINKSESLVISEWLMTRLSLYLSNGRVIILLQRAEVAHLSRYAQPVL